MLTRRIIQIIASTAAILAALLLPSSLHAQSPAPVLIYFYAWWWPGAMGEGKTPDWPDPLYYSSDAAVLQQQVEQIASAGIDGLVVGWYGPTEPDTERNFSLLLDLAGAQGISALLSVDLGTAAWFDSTQAIIDGMAYAINVHASHPAYFRYNGKPVFVFWFQGRYSMEDWAYIRQQVDPEHNTIWIAEGAVPDAIPVFDGLHMYTISWSENVYGTLSHWGNTVRDRGGLWMATAMPGWDNTYTQQTEKYIRARENGEFYRETFAAAAASNPNMLIITSWNEWAEGTYVEPSVKYGDFYLNLTRDLVGEYKSSGAVSGGSAASPPVYPTTTLPTDDGATAGEPAPQPADEISELPTATLPLPPTITPTQLSSPTPTPTQTAVPALVAEKPDQQAGADHPTGEALEENTAPLEIKHLIVGIGIVAGGLGLLLLGIFGALLARNGRSGSE